MAEPVRVRRLTDQEGRRPQQIVGRGSTSSVRYRRAMMLSASADGNRVPVTIAGVENREAVELVERAGIGVLLEDVLGHPFRTMPSDPVEQERADAPAAGLRSQIEVLGHVPLKGGMAENLPMPHRHSRPARLEQDILDLPGDLAVTALLRRQIRHGRHTRNHVDAGDHRHVSESDLRHANITHGGNLPGQPKHRPTDDPANLPGQSTSRVRPVPPRPSFRCRRATVRRPSRGRAAAR